MIKDDGALDRADDTATVQEEPAAYGPREPGSARRFDGSGVNGGDVNGSDVNGGWVNGHEGGEGLSGEGADGKGEGGGAKGKGKGAGAKPSRPFWKELPILIGVALVLSMLIKTFVVQPFYIPSGSMENTLGIGDRILVNKIVYHTRDIRRGDIVVFEGEDSWKRSEEPSPSSNAISRTFRSVGTELGFIPSGTDYIKRVIGLPGDHVQSKGHGAAVTVNGHPLNETSYIYPGNAPSERPFDITVPPGRLWVMGDHRGDSADSRFHTGDPGGGSIRESAVIGRAFIVVWPVGHGKMLSTPAALKDTAQAGGLAPEPAVSVPAFALAGLFVMRLRRRRDR